MAKKTSAGPLKRTASKKTPNVRPAALSGKKTENQGEGLERVRQGLTNPEVLRWVAELFKVMGDPSRLRIVNALLLMDLCVCDLASLLKMSPSAVSHQLQILKKSKLVKYRRSGKTVFYSLADAHVHAIIAQGAEHVGE